MDMGNIFCSLLVEALTTLFHSVALFRFMRKAFRRLHGGTSVPHFLLFAGASVDITSANVGAFSFHVSALPSDDTWWDGGSANKCSLLVRVLPTPAGGGALPFDVDALLLVAGWACGSLTYINNCILYE